MTGMTVTFVLFIYAHASRSNSSSSSYQFLIFHVNTTNKFINGKRRTESKKSEILRMNDENTLCRLCLEIAVKLHNIQDYTEHGKIADIICKHLRVEIADENEVSNKVCEHCWTITRDFHSFYERIQQAQENIITLVPIITEKVNENSSVEIKEELILNDDFQNIAKSNNGNDSIAIDKIDINTSLEQKESDIEQEGKKSKKKKYVTKHLKTEQVIEKQSRKFCTKIRRSQRNINRSIKNEKIEENVLKDDKEENVCITGITESKTSDDLKSMKIKKTKNVKKKREPLDTEKEKREEDLIESFFKMGCQVCRIECDKYVHLIDHYETVHGIRGFILCCGKHFYKRSILAEHINWHKNPNSFKCSICDKLYNTRHSLENHMITHSSSNMESYKCDQCSKQFTRKFVLSRHKLTHLSAEEKKYTCNDCHKLFAAECLLRAHRRVVHERKYSRMCEICAKVFNNRIFFEKHQLEHVGKSLPRVQCKLCSTWVKNEYTMRAHMRLHQDSGIIHECDICGKKGPSRNAISKHKLFVHLSERKYKCNMCDKAFKRPIYLKEHMTTHTGEILYKCTFCTKTFNSNSNMHKHRKRDHPKEWEAEKLEKELIKSNDGIPNEQQITN